MAKEDLTDPYEPTLEYRDALSMVVAAQEQAEQFSQNYVDKVERRYRAYRGMAELKVAEGAESYLPSGSASW